MKVMLLNGSCNANGTTARVLREAILVFEHQNIECKLFQMDSSPVKDCTGCGACKKNGNLKCIFEENSVNEFTKSAKSADGFIFASPVYYAHPSGRILSFLDRAFYSASSVFSYKPAASICVARRSGTVSSFDVLNKYFTISNMPVVSSSYWNNVFGKSSDDVEQDKEGLFMVRNLAYNMVWLLKCIENGKNAGIIHPEVNNRPYTNFIR